MWSAEWLFYLMKNGLFEMLKLKQAAKSAKQ